MTESMPLLTLPPIASDVQHCPPIMAVAEARSEAGSPKSTVQPRDKEEVWPLLLATLMLEEESEKVTVETSAVEESTCTSVLVAAVHAMSAHASVAHVPAVVCVSEHCCCSDGAAHRHHSSDEGAAHRHHSSDGHPVDDCLSADPCTTAGTTHCSGRNGHQKTVPLSNGAAGQPHLQSNPSSVSPSSPSSCRSGGEGHVRVSTAGEGPGPPYDVPSDGTDNEAAQEDSQLVHFGKACRRKVASLREAALMVRATAGSEGEEPVRYLCSRTSPPRPSPHFFPCTPSTLLPPPPLCRCGQHQGGRSSCGGRGRAQCCASSAGAAWRGLQVVLRWASPVSSREGAGVAFSANGHSPLPFCSSISCRAPSPPDEAACPSSPSGMGGPPVMVMYTALNTPKEVVRGTNAWINVLEVRKARPSAGPGMTDSPFPLRHPAWPCPL